MINPLVTIAVPSYNQGQFINDTLESIFEQNIPVEVWVMDGGSTDNSIEIIKKWEKYLAGWRSYKDNGQASAINEGIARGTAPYVGWINSDDWLLPHGLANLILGMEQHPEAAAVYGRAWNVIEHSKKQYPVWVEPFNEQRLSIRCIISQPATLIRRKAWEAVAGLNPNLHMAMDFDLWWKLYKLNNKLEFIDHFIAVNRVHANTKTKTQKKLHYQEAIQIVRKYHGRVPLKWWCKSILRLI